MTSTRKTPNQSLSLLSFLHEREMRVKVADKKLFDFNVPKAQSSSTDEIGRLQHHEVLVVREVVEGHEVQVEIESPELVYQKIPALDQARRKLSDRTDLT